MWVALGRHSSVWSTRWRTDIFGLLTFAEKAKADGVKNSFIPVVVMWIACLSTGVLDEDPSKTG
jgi:hypothetical protein